MEERIIAAADLGTTKIALSIAKVTGERTEILYYKETPSAGIRYSCVFNPMKAAERLKEAISVAENELGIKIDQMFIGKPRYPINERTASGRTERSDADAAITQNEVYVVKNFAIDSYDGIEQPEKEVIYGAVPQSFSTDDGIQLSEEDVVGMPSSYLEGNFKIFIGHKKALNNIDAVLNDVGVAQSGQLFLPDATARAVLSQDELENGVALVEMGGGVTSLSIYKGDILRHYSAIPFGGKNVTTDIKYECGISAELAENIKLAFGGCLPDRLSTMTDKIIQIEDDLDGSRQQIPVKDLSAIITAREEEILDAILYKIQQSGYADKLRTGVVLTGGAAEMTNLVTLLKEKSGYNVRIGYPRLRQFSADGISEIGAPSAAASVGLLMLAKENNCIGCAHNVDPIEEEEQNPMAEDSVFTPVQETTEAQTVQEKGGKRKANKPEQKKKPHFEWRHLQKISKAVDDSFSSLGNLFDDLN